jgi:hypothetical protein
MALRRQPKGRHPRPVRDQPGDGRIEANRSGDILDHAGGDGVPARRLARLIQRVDAHYTTLGLASGSVRMPPLHAYATGAFDQFDPACSGGSLRSIPTFLLLRMHGFVTHY